MAVNNNGQLGSKAPRTIAVFEKALQAFSIGDLPYSDVQSYMQSLLTSGVPAEDLLKVLRRREQVEPLPEYARLDISRVLIERKMWPDAQPPPVADNDPGPPADSAADAMATATAAATAAATANPPAAGSAMEDERLALREVLAAREQTIRELAGAVADSDTRSASMQADLQRVRSELETRARGHDQLEAALASERERADALAAELAAARTTLSDVIESANDQVRRESERHRADSEELRATLASRNAAFEQMSDALKERADQLAALQINHAAAVAALEERNAALWRLQADLEASRAHGMALQANLDAVQGNLDAVQANLTSVQRDTSVRSRDAVALLEKNAQLESELQTAKSQAAGLRSQLQQTERLVERLHTAAQREAPRATPAAVETAPVQARPAPARAEPAPLQAEPPLLLAETAPAPANSPAEDEFAARRMASAAVLRGGTLFGRGGKSLTFGAAVALVMLALAAGFSLHQRPAQAPATAAAPAVTAIPGSQIRDCPTCPALTVLPAGRFKQGSARPERAAQSERPQHWVSIARPFALSTNPITVDDFAAFIAATHRDMKGCDIYDGRWRHRADADWQHPGFAQTGAHPVTCVSWNDAKAYAEWLSATTGQHYRLPSASEWEYAARTGGDAAQPWKSDDSAACSHANVADKSAAGRFPRLATFSCDDGYVFTAPVGSFKANAFGLNDLLGNVFQWTEDCWAADYIHAPQDGSPRKSGDCSEHEIRGGSWSSDPNFVRANARNHVDSNHRASSFGIRLAREVAS